MTAPARTRRKHQRRCEQCRHLYAPTSTLPPGNKFCAGCLEKMGHGAANGGGVGVAPKAGGKVMVPDAEGGAGGPALAPAHRRHVRPHRPERAK